MAQRDTRLYIAVAEDLKDIAAANRQDSNAMKTISMLTMVFLPGTFVSVRLKFSPRYPLPLLLTEGDSLRDAPAQLASRRQRSDCHRAFLDLLGHYGAAHSPCYWVLAPVEPDRS
jgi:hypothetical protein